MAPAFALIPCERTNKVIGENFARLFALLAANVSPKVGKRCCSLSLEFLQADLSDFGLEVKRRIQVNLNGPAKLVLAYAITTPDRSFKH